MAVIWIALVCGLGVAVGVGLVVGGWLGWAGPRIVVAWARKALLGISLRTALALIFGLVCLVATRWPVAAVLAAGFGAVAPNLFSGRNAAKVAIARTEAIASWTEMLRDTMAGAAGLQGAIEATAKAAPVAIGGEVENLARRLRHDSLAVSLRSFADEVNHPTADLVVASLLLASNREAKSVGVMLGTLAEAARADATMRLRVEAGRARTKTSVRVVVGFASAMAFGLVVLNRSYLQPYDSAVGQLVLAGVGAAFIGAFVWMNNVAKIDLPPRLLSATEVQS